MSPSATLLKLRLLAHSLLVTALVASSALAWADSDFAGTEKIYSDIRTAAKKGKASFLKSNLGPWRIKSTNGAVPEVYCGDGPNDPNNPFKVIETDEGGGYEVWLVKPQQLFDEDGMLKAIHVVRSSGAEALPAQANSEIAVTFKNDFNEDIDLTDAKIQNIKIEPAVCYPPGKDRCANFIRLEGKKAYFRRESGEAERPLTVTMDLVLKGKSRTFKATLPPQLGGEQCEYGWRKQTARIRYGVVPATGTGYSREYAEGECQDEVIKRNSEWLSQEFYTSISRRIPQSTTWTMWSAHRCQNCANADTGRIERNGTAQSRLSMKLNIGAKARFASKGTAAKYLRTTTPHATQSTATRRSCNG